LPSKTQTPTHTKHKHFFCGEAPRTRYNYCCAGTIPPQVNPDTGASPLLYTYSMKTRQKKTHRRKTRGGGFTTNRKKTFKENESNCARSTLAEKNYTSCKDLAHKYDFRGYFEGAEHNEFFKPAGSPSPVTSKTAFRKTTYMHNGEEIDTSKIKWYYEIGSKIIWSKRKMCYVLKPTPLTVEEIKSNTLEGLEEMANQLPCVTDEQVEDWYRQGSDFFNH
jgi:hypothetical protein